MALSADTASRTTRGSDCRSNGCSSGTASDEPVRPSRRAPLRCTNQRVSPTSAANRETARKNNEKARAFFRDVAPGCFSVAFLKLDNVGALMDVVGLDADDFEENTSRAEKLRVLRESLARAGIGRGLGWQDFEEGPEHIARHLQGVATTWGVKLPDDWMETAARYAAEPVSVETEEGADDASDDEYDE